MDHHLERRVILNTDSEFQSLYKWSLREIKEDGTRDGRDQIPWEWSLYFTASELTLNDTFVVKESFHAADEESRVRERQTIVVKLTPGSPWSRYDRASYSMLGTGRTISTFNLTIETLPEGMEREKCTAWGSVSFTSEIDFRDDTTDDTIVFYLYVRPETFALYAQKIAARQIDEAVFRVGGVDGFYSDWSPSISTDDVKVLTGYEEHAVEIQRDCEIVPPRLGKVRDAELDLRRKCKVEPEPDSDAQDDDEWRADDGASAPGFSLGADGASPPDEEPHLAGARRNALAHAQTMKMLASLRMAAWVIAALLLVIVIR